MHGWEATVSLLRCENVFKDSVLDLLFGLYLEVPTVASVSHSLPEQSESATLILHTGHHFRTTTPLKQLMGGCATFPILNLGFPANNAFSQDKTHIPSAFLLMLTQKLSPFQQLLRQRNKVLMIRSSTRVSCDTGHRNNRVWIGEWQKWWAVQKARPTDIETGICEILEMAPIRDMELKCRIFSKFKTTA